MLKTLTTALITAALGAGAAVGLAACGEDRGSVEIEGGGTTATSPSTTPTTPTSP